LHVQKDLGLYRMWRGKCRKRGAQMLGISTAGEPGTDFEETRDRLRERAIERERVRLCWHRYVTPGLVMHEFKVPSVEQARDLDVVKAANPLSAVTKAQLAELLADETLDWGEDWLRKTCNIPARSSEAAISDADWDDAQVDEEIPAGVPVWVGADFAWSLDTTALVPLWVKDDSTGCWGRRRSWSRRATAACLTRSRSRTRLSRSTPATRSSGW
jgi:phage terminase large subunit-like protein